MQRIYLDHLSTTPLRPEVFHSMEPFFKDSYGNPASLHQEGLKAAQALAEAREKVSEFISAESPEEILFTSDGSESANLAIKGAALAQHRGGRHRYR